MRKFIEFREVSEGELFFANGMLHCKTMDGIFRLPSPSFRNDYNSFYASEGEGVWAYFDDKKLVQKYDATIHGSADEVLRIRSQF